jgi:F-type H+-transporting ATPase subunit epsilon
MLYARRHGWNELVNMFVIHLQSATQYERIENALSFVGQDDSGSFGILPGHSRMMTLLSFGLARFRVVDQDWEYLALPGALAYFRSGELFVSARRYLRGKDYQGITARLEQELRAEEAALREMKQSMRRLEEEMFKRLWRVKRGEEISV